MIRRVLFGAAVAALIGIIILIISLARGSGTNEPIEPVIRPAASETPAAEPEITASAEPTVAPISSADETNEIGATPSPEPAAPAADADANLRSVHVRVVGDIMFHKEQLEFAKRSDGTYVFYDQFAYIYESLRAADYTIANLETTVGKSEKLGYSGYPQFNTPETALQTLRDCGINFFTLANNHMLDRYYDGMVKTVGLVEKYGFDHVGAYPTREDRDAPVIYEIKGIKIGFVAYTHTTNTLEKYSDAKAKEFGVPWLYESDIENDIKKLREAGAEVVIALPHWGTENVNQPDDTQKKYAVRLAKAGADIILGNHSHMVQPMGLFTGTDNYGNEKEVFLIYSLGNFISSMTMKYTDCGIILDFTIEEQADGTFRVRDIGYVPVFVWKQDGKVTVVPSGKFLDQRPDGMNDAQYKRLLESYRETVEHLGTNGFTVLAE